MAADLDQQILDALTKDTGKPPTWADTYNKWFATEYLPWINSRQGTNVRVSDLSLSDTGTIIPNASVPLWNWNTGGDTAAQKAALDERYKASLAAYNQQQGTNIQPDTAVLGANVQPNTTYRAPDKSGWASDLASLAAPVALGLATGGLGSALGASLGIGAIGGTALAGAGLGALQGQDLGQIATSAAIGGVAGGIGSGVGSSYGKVAGQLAGQTAGGLLSGRDLGSSLSNAALGTAGYQAAGSVLNAFNTPTETPTPTIDYTSGANYDLTQGQNIGGLGLQETGGEGLTLGGIGYNIQNNITGQPLGQELAGITTGAEGYLTPQTPTLANPNPAAQATLGKLFTSFLAGSSGTGNMATTTTDNNAALASLMGGLLGGAGNLMQGSTNTAARQAQADALRQAGAQAAQQATFKPVGTTTRFGASNYTVDPTTGAISAGYTPSALAQGYQNQLAGMTSQGLLQGQQIQGLANQYLGESPEAVRQRYVQQQTALLAPQQEQQLAGIRNNLFQTGRQGLATGATSAGGLAATNPEMAAYYNSLANQQRQIAAGADTAAQQQIQFGQGLAGQAYQPFTAGFGAQGAVETAAQRPLTLSSDIAKLQSGFGAQAGQLGLGANTAAANAMLSANQYNPYASLLSGAGGSTQLTGALGGLLGSTGAGASLGNWLGSLGANNNTAQATYDWMQQNPNITPESTFSGSGDATWMNDWWMQ